MKVFAGFLAAVLLTVCAAGGAYAKYTTVIKHPLDFKKIGAEIDEKWNDGYVPVGVEVIGSGKDKGIWILYVQNDENEFENWAVYRYDDKEELEEGVNGKMEDGWIPFDIAVVNESVYVFYLKMEDTAKAWKIETAEDFSGVKPIVDKLAKKNFLPVGISATSDGEMALLLVQFPGHSIENWKIMSYKNFDAMEEDLDEKTDDGWQPYGYMFKDSKIHVLMLQ